MKLSIIIPAYNEEKRIIPTLKDYYSFFSNKLKNNFELIIVPNNCSDKTFEVTKNFSRLKNQIRILNIDHYVGKGGAVMKGFEIANGDLISFTDADNSTNPENFYKLYKNLKNNEGIIASRKLKDSVVFPKRRLNQEISSKLFSFVVRILFNLNYKDTQCGAKIFTKKCANFLIKNYSETGWNFDVDLLYLCKKNNFKIIEFPIAWKDSEGSKLTNLDGIKSVYNLIRYRFNSFFKSPKQ